jgi:hypothetical protein
MVASAVFVAIGDAYAIADELVTFNSLRSDWKRQKRRTGNK